MSDLYKEALIEAKKLRKIAEEDATRSIIQDISPYIKKIMAEEISSMGGSAPGDAGFFFEQEEEEALPTATAAPEGTAPTKPTEPMTPADVSPPAADLGDKPEAAPLSTTGADSGMGGTQMPDEEGKITVDFEDLFSGVDEIAPGDSVAPVPTPTEAEPPADDAAAPGAEGGLSGLMPSESMKYESFAKGLHEISEKIDRAFFKESINEVVQDSLKNRLFSLLEQLDELSENGEIDSKKAKINENKLEFLFLKLKEAKLANSYNKKEKRENSMASLREYAAKLFEEDNSTYAADGKEDGLDQPTSASGKHAAKNSGVSPELGEKGLKASAVNEEMLPGTAGSVDHDALPGTDPKPGSEQHWADGEPALKEKDQDKVIEEALDSLVSEEVEAKGSAGFGDTDENPAVEFEVDDKALAEAVREIRKENIRKKLRALKETKKADGPKTDAKEEEWEDGEPEGGKDPSHAKLKEAEDFSFDVEDDEDDAAALPPPPPMAGGDDSAVIDDVVGDDMAAAPPADDMEAEGDLVLNIDLPDEVEDALAGVDISALDDVTVSLADVNIGAGSDDDAGVGGDVDGVSDEMMVDAGADDEGDTDLDDVGGDEDEEPALENMDPTVHEEMNEARKKAAAKKKGAFKGAAAPFKKKGDKKDDKKLTEALSAARKESEGLKQNLREANLFLAKNVYFTKFLQRGDLSKKNLGKIVDYLDGARTVAEAKTIYGKIKAKLAESTSASKKLAGSSSKVTTPGSATPAAALKESVNRVRDPNDPVVSTVQRWQQLAGIKNTEKK